MNVNNHPRRYTVTAALPYANGPIHIGHVAGVYLPADIYVRYLRRNNCEVLFISGSDEHGVPITIRAKQEGVTPKEIIEQYHTLNKKTLKDFGISFDIFARTSSLLHYQTAADFFKKLYTQGIFEVYETEQYYDPIYQQFLSDRYIKGSCPRCGYQEAYGDQCESCGSTLSPNELTNIYSTLSKMSPMLKKTKHWYLPLNKYEGWLKEWILEEHKEWKTNVYGQCKSWLAHGLQPRAVTRDLSWGVPVPLKEGKDKVLYVWFDAPIGYISATKEWAITHQQAWEPFWQYANTQLVHFIGKDNIVFHCIIFPVMLKAYGSFILPTYIPAYEFLNLEGSKISTSKNHAVWLHKYLEDFEGKQDVLRYVLCINGPENKDSDFSWKDFQLKNNNELVGILGNFVHRTFILVHKYFQGIVPVRGSMTALDRSTLAYLHEIPQKVGKAIQSFHFKSGLQLSMEHAALGNKYLTDTAPWHLIRDSTERAGTVLNIALQIVALLAVVLEPFMPHTAKKLQEMLYLTVPCWDSMNTNSLVQPGVHLKEPTFLFTKIEDEFIQQQCDLLHLK